MCVCTYQRATVIVTREQLKDEDDRPDEGDEQDETAYEQPNAFQPDVELHIRPPQESVESGTVPPARGVAPNDFRQTAVPSVSSNRRDGASTFLFTPKFCFGAPTKSGTFSQPEF
jgi:hypothetical protein